MRCRHADDQSSRWHWSKAGIPTCKVPLGGYVLRPLLDVGLLERKSPSEWPGVTEKDEIRTTALWRKFIHFEPWAGDAL